ncbi:MAG: hypothetical protein CL930_03945 [Deltaproteobacteria bacterium]|nr:hypothetical protein [Deltaproteobacteria bacterium]
MSTKLDSGLERALRTYKDAVRKIGVKEVNPPVLIKGPQTLVDWLPGAKKALRTVRKGVERDLAVVQAQIAANKGAGSGNTAAWKRLDDAIRKLESELVSPSTVRQRMDEGRRSMMPRVEKVVAERLVPMVTDAEGRLVAELDQAQIKSLEQELPSWIKAWSEYAFRWIEQDRAMLVEQLWKPREGDLPVPPPTIRPLELPTFNAGIQFPQISIERKAKGGVGSTLRHGRSVMYGLLSVAMLGGINLRGGGGDKGEMLPWMILVAVGAIGIGFAQAKGERAQEVVRLTENAETKAQQAIRDTLRIWLDRCTDKILQSLREQLADRRNEMVDWYRGQVMPALQRQLSESAARGGDADDARRKLPRLQEKERDVKRAGTSLEALETLLAQATSVEAQPET